MKKIIFLLTIVMAFAFTSCNEPPQITCPADMTETVVAGECTVTVDYVVSATDSWDGNGDTNNPGNLTFTLLQGLPSGSDFYVGTHVIEYEVTDIDGLTDSCSFEITVDGNLGPVISCPPDISVDSEPGECGAVVNFADATALDPEGNPVIITQTAGPASGSLFPIGTTTIEFTATDDCPLNPSTCSFDITVTDIEAPMAVCQDLTIELDASGSASITTADIDNGSSDNCAGFTLALDMMVFDCSNVGDNTVTLTVTDADGLTDSCTATVTVEDNQAPEVYCKGGAAVLTIEENFDAGVMPAGWTTEHSNGSVDLTPGGCGASEFSFECNHNPHYTDGDNPNFSGTCAMIDDDANGSGVDGKGSILSSVYDISNGAVSISFDYENADFAGSGDFIVEVYDGSAWVEVYRQEDDANGHEDIDISAYNNADFQVKFSYDDEGGWNWGAAFDNFVLAYLTAATPPHEVDLMADGTVVVNAADLLFDVIDNCGYSVGIAPSPCDQSNPSNGLENGYFTDAGHGNTIANDLVLDPNTSMTLTQVTANLFHAVGATITSIDLYYFSDNGGPDTFLGSQMAVAPTSQTVLGNAFGFDVSECLFDVDPFMFAGGATETKYWIAMQATASDAGTTAWEVSTATSTGGSLYLYNGVSWSEKAGDDGVYTFAGLCGYSVLEFDCSDLGENTVNVIVTDAGGNEATCSATVIVHDTTAPELVCGPDPVLMGSVTDAPGAAIPDDDAAGISLTIDVTDDFPITDLNVPVNISHTWSGDILITLTSPAGTMATLRDQTGGSEMDIIETYDDEGVLPVDALSIFDGESSLGTWTLFVSDNAGADTGVVNSWGLDYTYDNPTTDLIFELDENGEVHITADDMTSTMYDACGFDVVLLDITDFDCSDIGAPIMVTLFVNDASGNFASCQKEVNIVDASAPDLTCPGDVTEPSDNAGVFTLPDYFVTGDAFFSDNCTADGDIIFTQTPAPGTVLGINDGTPIPPYVISFTAEDANGNIATCEFELVVTYGVGVSENALLADGLSISPNPADDLVQLRNVSEFAIESAMIYDVNGKLVAQFELENQEINTLDVSNLATGVFMVKVIGKDASTVKQLIVK